MFVFASWQCDWDLPALLTSVLNSEVGGVNRDEESLVHMISGSTKTCKKNRKHWLASMISNNDAKSNNSE